MNNNQLIALIMEAVEKITGRTIQPGQQGQIMDYVTQRVTDSRAQSTSAKSFAQPLKQNKERDDAITEDLHD